MRELNKFYDKNLQVWEIKRERGQLILAKNGINLVWFLDDQTGERNLKRKINTLKG